MSEYNPVPYMLKSYQDIYKQEPYFSVGASISLEDYHRIIAAYKLCDAVPIHVKESFETARNLQLYSWFVYRFGIVAAKQSLTSLELALKLYAQEKGYMELKGLRNLLEKANKEKWISFNRYENPQGFIDSLCSLRNDFAHGSTMLMEPTQFIHFIKNSSELINELYNDTQ